MWKNGDSKIFNKQQFIDGTAAILKCVIITFFELNVELRLFLCVVVLTFNDTVVKPEVLVSLSKQKQSVIRETLLNMCNSYKIKERKEVRRIVASTILNTLGVKKNCRFWSKFSKNAWKISFRMFLILGKFF